MELIFDKIKELTQEQFEALLDFIGYENLRSALIEQAGSFPKTSPYYLGSKFTGQIWQGFRKDKIPSNRVKKFYVDEVYKSKLNLKTDFFKKVIENRISKLDEFTESFIFNCDTNLRSTLCVLYGVQINEETEKHLSEINEIKKNYEKKVNELKNEYEKQIINLKEEAYSQKQEYEIIIKDLNSRLESINKENRVNVCELFKKIIDYSINKDLSSSINSLNLENENDVKKYLKKSFNRNLTQLDSSDYSNLANELTIQYIITKIMEAK